MLGSKTKTKTPSELHAEKKRKIITRKRVQNITATSDSLQETGKIIYKYRIIGFRRSSGI